MKVKISPKRIITQYIIIGLITGILFYGIAGFSFPPTSLHYFLLVIWLLLTIGYTIHGLYSNYYIIDERGIIHRRFNNELLYRYDDIIYLDEPYSLKRKNLRFVTSFGHIRYLPHDQQKEVFKAIKQHSQLTSYEQLIEKFPNIKF